MRGDDIPAATSTPAPGNDAPAPGDDCPETSGGDALATSEYADDATISGDDDDVLTRATIEVCDFFSGGVPQFRGLRPLPRMIWRKVKLLPCEKSHGLGTQHENHHAKETRRICDDVGLRIPSFRNHFRQKPVYLYRSTRLLLTPRVLIQRSQAKTLQRPQASRFADPRR